MLLKLFLTSSVCLLAVACGIAPLLAEDITPRVGAIEVYGNRKTSASKILRALEMKPGDPPAALGDAIDRINKVSGVLGSRVEATCCVQGKVTLYVGVEERDAPHIEFHPAPTGDVTLPDEVVDNYHSFIEEVTKSVRDDLKAQDLTNGYSLMASAVGRTLQLRFRTLVARDLADIDKVIRSSADPEQRTIAAYVLQYTARGPHTNDIMVNALMYGLQDSEDSVRENAMRSLKAIAVGAKMHPDQEIHLSPTWFVELLNSPVYSDRRNASLALVDLTDDRDPAGLQLIRDRALPSVIEMAKWHDMRDALPPFMLAGRVAGLSDDQIKAAWVSGDRDAVVQQALSPKRKFHISNKKST